MELENYSTSWDQAKPNGCNIKTWRRKQVQNFVIAHPHLSKPKEVMKWILAHNPNPWPNCNNNTLSKIINRLKKGRSPQGRAMASSHDRADVNLTRDEVVMRFDFKPLEVKWQSNPNKELLDIHKWRRVQLSRYLKMYPDHGPTRIMQWLNEHTPNP